MVYLNFWNCILAGRNFKHSICINNLKLQEVAVLPSLHCEKDLNLIWQSVVPCHNNAYRGHWLSNDRNDRKKHLVKKRKTHKANWSKKYKQNDKITTLSPFNSNLKFKLYLILFMLHTIDQPRPHQHQHQH